MQENQWQEAPETVDTAAIPETQKQAPEDNTFSLERPANRRLKKAPILILGTSQQR